MKKIADMLYEICEDERVYEENIDLIESGLLDSYSFIELFTSLEDEGIFLQPTQIDRTCLRTIAGIEDIIEEYLSNRK